MVKPYYAMYGSVPTVFWCKFVMHGLCHLYISLWHNCTSHTVIEMDSKTIYSQTASTWNNSIQQKSSQVHFQKLTDRKPKQTFDQSPLLWSCWACCSADWPDMTGHQTSTNILYTKKSFLSSYRIFSLKYAKTPSWAYLSQTQLFNH